nr:aldehyde dehydrogenase family protein [Planctomycetota bacterium]
MDTIENFIGGRWLPARDGRTQEQHNPADLGEITARFQRSDRADAVDAIDAATAAFPAWSGATMRERARVLTTVVARMRASRDDIARSLSHENGKTLREALGEVDAAAAEMEWQIGEGLRLPGEITPSAHSGVLAYVTRRPLGVVSVICPWNFPFNVPARKCTPALM